MKILDYSFYFAVGAAGGAVVTIAGWAIFSHMLDRQFQAAAGDFVRQGGTELRRTLDQEIPARVRQEMDAKLREVGITRDTGRQLAALLAGAERIGLIGLRGGGLGIAIPGMQVYGPGQMRAMPAWYQDYGFRR